MALYEIDGQITDSGGTRRIAMHENVPAEHVERLVAMYDGNPIFTDVQSNKQPRRIG